MRGTDEQAITFTDGDPGKVLITLLIADYMTRKALIDNGSSADILYYLAFE